MLNVSIRYNEDGRKRWCGPISYMEQITVRSPGDEYKDYVTGWIYGVLESGGNWVMLRRDVPEQRKISDYGDYTLS